MPDPTDPAPKPAAPPPTSDARPSSAANVVPLDLEVRLATARLALTTGLDETKNDGLPETVAKRLAMKARLSELEHLMKNILDGFANASAESKAKIEDWLSRA